MLLIFGFRIRLRTTGEMPFFCPRCGGDRTGLRRVARRWFTLFWIPVIPLGQVGEVVECSTCGTRYEPEAADRPTTTALSQVLGDAVRVLTAMVVRTGDAADPAMRLAAVDAVRGVDPAYDAATLEGDVAGVEPHLADRYVAPLADHLATAGKERLLGDLVRVALAGGTVTGDQRRVIDVAGRGLGLTPAHVTGIVTSVASGSTPAPPPVVDPPLPD